MINLEETARQVYKVYKDNSVQSEGWCFLLDFVESHTDSMLFPFFLEKKNMQTLEFGKIKEQWENSRVAKGKKIYSEFSDTKVMGYFLSPESQGVCFKMFIS